MHTRASNSELVEPLPEPERTLNRRLRRRNRRVPFEQRNNPPQHPRIVYPPILNINYFRHFLDILRNYDPMDNEPMWAADRVVAPTLGSAITIPETANEFAIKAKFDILADKQSGRPSGSLPSNTQPNTKGSSSKPYQLPQARNENVNAIFTQSGKSYDPPDNLNDQQNDSETPINFDSDDEYDEPTLKPKPKTPKPELINNKLKIEQISAAFLSDESSVILQNKVPPKLGDHGKLSLETLKPTKMSVRLVDRSFQYPDGIAKNMLAEVGKFTFPADFVILEMEQDSKVPLILGRPFLHTVDAVIRVKQKQLNLGVGTE
ncbi:reverse transcriptase domain-containing protein [Tanacetum coccineum]